MISNKLGLAFCGLFCLAAGAIAEYKLANNHKPDLPDMKCNLAESGDVITETLGNSLHITLPAGIENEYPSYILCQPK